MKKLINLMLLSLAFGSCQSTISNSSNDLKSDWKVLSKESFSIQYPEAWDLDESGQMGTIFFLFSPLETDDNFRENINLVIQDLKDWNIDLDKFTEITENQIGTIISNSTIIKSERLKDCHHLVYSGGMGIYYLIFEQYFWIVNDKAYILTFTAEQDKYQDCKDLAKEIMNTFEIKK